MVAEAECPHARHPGEIEKLRYQLAILGRMVLVRENTARVVESGECEVNTLIRAERQHLGRHARAGGDVTPDRTEEVHEQAVGEVHVGSEEDPEAVADRVYNPDSWSFFQGRTGGWRELFTRRNLDQFREQYGDLLEQFGYE